MRRAKERRTARSRSESTGPGIDSGQANGVEDCPQRRHVGQQQEMADQRVVEPSTRKEVSTQKT